jgi:hypothetical protein
MNTKTFLPLLIFYIISALSRHKTHLSVQLHEYINTNIYVQHIIACATLFILITLNNKIDTHTGLLYTFIGYAWYILSTKLDLHWNIIIVILLFIGYMMENNNKLKYDNILNDNVLTQEQKKTLINKMDVYNTNLLIFIFCITLIGTIFYNQKKYIQYGHNYDRLVYFFGKN